MVFILYHRGWGNAWRDRREFVGRLDYGTVFKLWNPEVQPKFGNCFQDGSRALFMCQRRWESPFSMLPDEAIYYILNMCRWDWFDDNNVTMKDRRKREKLRNKKQLVLIEQQQQQQQNEAAAAAAATVPMEDGSEDAKPRARETACARTTTASGKTTGLNGSEEEDAKPCANSQTVAVLADRTTGSKDIEKINEDCFGTEDDDDDDDDDLSLIHI